MGQVEGVIEEEEERDGEGEEDLHALPVWDVLWQAVEVEERVGEVEEEAHWDGLRVGVWQAVGEEDRVGAGEALPQSEGVVREVEEDEAVKEVEGELMGVGDFEGGREAEAPKEALWLMVGLVEGVGLWDTVGDTEGQGEALVQAVWEPLIEGEEDRLPVGVPGMLLLPMSEALPITVGVEETLYEEEVEGEPEERRELVLAPEGEDWALGLLEREGDEDMEGEREGDVDLL